MVSARMLSSNVRELTFEAATPFTFQPGQWVNFFLPNPSAPHEPIKRSYSIASPPRADGRFDIAVTLVPEGPMSTFLHDASVGTTLQISPVYGVFVLEPVVRPVLMIAAGTGIAPFRSMLHALAASPPDRPVQLLFGARTEGDILYRDELEDIARRWRGFTFHPTLSRGSDAWVGRRGHVQLHVAELLQALGVDTDAYVCGLNKMVHDVKRMLREELKLERKRVHIERYD